MESESINSNESQMNNDALLPLIDNMLNCRKEFTENTNKMFNTNISVEFDSSWEDNIEEHDAEMKALENSIQMENEGGEPDEVVRMA